MLKRVNRLGLYRDIARVRLRGIIRRGDLFTLRYIERQEGKESRFCFVASKKISKRAVDRNKVVRWAREAVFGALPQLGVAIDVLVMAQKKFEDYSFALTKKDIENLIEQIGSTKNNANFFN